MKRVANALALFVGSLTGCAGCASSTAGAGGNGPETPGEPAPTLPTEPDTSVASCRPEVDFRGAPIDAAADTWTWVPFPESRCRDGSSTGIGVRRHPGSNQLVIYLEGGGACFHDASCLINDPLQNWGEAQFNAWASSGGTGGIFDPTREDNPFRGWNMVYVPYCSGDVHAGNREHVDVPGGPKDQFFVGYRNIGQYLQRVVPTFADASHVVVTGISAGGFGAAFNYDRVAQAFCGARVTLVDDSGPPMADDYLAPCLQKRWRDLWNLDGTLPADCTACRGANGGGIVNYVPYLTKKYPKAELGLISANQDGIISLFFGFGENNCAGLYGPSTGMPAAKFEAGLDELRDRFFASGDQLGSYIVPSTSHTWTTGLTFYNTSVSGVPLPEWVSMLVLQNTAVHVNP
jgi:Pectinacetylesterase